MKKPLLLICAALFSVMLISCGSSVERAKNYNHDIIKEQVAINTKIENLFDSFKNYIPEKMDTVYAEAVTQLKAGMDSVSKMDAFDGNTEFRDAAIALFNIYDSVLNNEFKEMITLLKLPEKQYNKEKEERCITLRDQIMHKIDVGFTKLTHVQNNFAKEYNLDIEDSK
jgi:hypothetical protein